MIRPIRVASAGLALLLAGCGATNVPQSAGEAAPNGSDTAGSARTAQREDTMPVTTSTLALRSPAFASGGEIPGRHTCDGADLAPPLEWSGAPPGTRSFALIVEDPDAPDPMAPKVTWVHWVVYDLPAGTTSLPEGGALPPGAREGLNDWMRAGWGGPCPPIGRHRYFFRLFALDQPLGSLGRPAAAKLHGVMRDHVLARAELMGTYERRK